MLHLGTKPEHAASTTEVDDGARHVRMPPLVKAHVPGLGEPEDLSDTARVDEVRCVDEWRHRVSVARDSDPSD
jgi:hypothetical protein